MMWALRICFALVVSVALQWSPALGEDVQCPCYLPEYPCSHQNIEDRSCQPKTSLVDGYLVCAPGTVLCLRQNTSHYNCSNCFSDSAGPCRAPSNACSSFITNSMGCNSGTVACTAETGVYVAALPGAPTPPSTTTTTTTTNATTAASVSTTATATSATSATTKSDTMTPSAANTTTTTTPSATTTKASTTNATTPSTTATTNATTPSTTATTNATTPSTTATTNATTPSTATTTNKSTTTPSTTTTTPSSTTPSTTTTTPSSTSSSSPTTTATTKPTTATTTSSSSTTTKATSSTTTTPTTSTASKTTTTAKAPLSVGEDALLVTRVTLPYDYDTIVGEDDSAFVAAAEASFRALDGVGQGVDLEITAESGSITIIAATSSESAHSAIEAAKASFCVLFGGESLCVMDRADPSSGNSGNSGSSSSGSSSASTAIGAGAGVAGVALVLIAVILFVRKNKGAKGAEKSPSGNVAPGAPVQNFVNPIYHRGSEEQGSGSYLEPSLSGKASHENFYDEPLDTSHTYAMPLLKPNSEYASTGTDYLDPTPSRSGAPSYDVGSESSPNNIYHVAFSSKQDATYDMGRSAGDPSYDLGRSSGRQEDGFGFEDYDYAEPSAPAKGHYLDVSPEEPVVYDNSGKDAPVNYGSAGYANSASSTEDPIYHQVFSPRSAGAVAPTYDIGKAGGEQPVYDVASQTRGGTAPNAAPSRKVTKWGPPPPGGAAQPVYDTGAARPAAAKDPVYDLGNSSLGSTSEPTYDNRIERREGSGAPVYDLGRDTNPVYDNAKA